MTGVLLLSIGCCCPQVFAPHVLVIGPMVVESLDATALACFGGGFVAQVAMLFYLHNGRIPRLYALRREDIPPTPSPYGRYEPRLRV